MRMLAVMLGLSMFAGTVSAEAFDLDKRFNTIFAHLNNKIYVISETSASTEDYEAAMSKAATKLKELLEDPALNEAALKTFVENDPMHNGLLHDAAFYGYYPLVEVLLKDDRVKAQLNTANKMGLNALELGRGALKSHFVFTYPERLCSPFGLVPLMVNDFSFYKSALQPYEKTAQLLKEAGAKSDSSVQDIYKQFLNYRIKKATEPSIAKPIQQALTIQMEAGIKQIEAITSTSDQQVLSELSNIQMSVLNQQEFDKTYDYVNVEAFDHLCDALDE